jgi:hypothetical protein
MSNEAPGTVVTLTELYKWMSRARFDNPTDETRAASFASQIKIIIDEAARTPSTPAAQWRGDGEPDPHDTRYNCERAQLCMGNLTDDELANGAFMNYDQPLNIPGILAKTHTSPIGWMTAVKDRIRWLSRRLEEATAAPKLTECRHCGFYVALNEAPADQAQSSPAAPVISSVHGPDDETPAVPSAAHQPSGAPPTS